MKKFLSISARIGAMFLLVVLVTALFCLPSAAIAAYANITEDGAVIKAATIAKGSSESNPALAEETDVAYLMQAVQKNNRTIISEEGAFCQDNVWRHALKSIEDSLIPTTMSLQETCHFSRAYHLRL